MARDATLLAANAKSIVDTLLMPQTRNAPTSKG
jgi:hypothetical protein